MNIPPMMRTTTRSKPRVSVDTFRDDPLYPRIVRAVERLLARGKVVAPVDCNLTRLSRLLRILRFHAHDLKLVPSITVYERWGKGPKQRLRFTKTADPKLEEAYARHFVWPGKGPVR
jgi:hypothetical protein